MVHPIAGNLVAGVPHRHEWLSKANPMDMVPPNFEACWL